jgi:hypothetical protein
VTVIALITSMFLSVGSLYWGYVQAGFAPASHWILIMGMLWLFSEWRHWTWFSSLVLFAFVFFSAFGLIFGFDFGWMLAGSVFALFAWDMTDFRRRLRFAAEDDDSKAMERRHLGRLTVLSLAGLLLVTAALFIQVKFTFEWGVLLVVFVLFGVIQLINSFRRQNK